MGVQLLQGLGEVALLLLELVDYFLLEVGFFLVEGLFFDEAQVLLLFIRVVALSRRGSPILVL